MYVYMYFAQYKYLIIIINYYYFGFFARIAIRSIYPPFVQILMYLRKTFSNILPCKKLGEVGKVRGGGGGGNSPPVRKGKGWQQK